MVLLEIVMLYVLIRVPKKRDNFTVFLKVYIHNFSQIDKLYSREDFKMDYEKSFLISQEIIIPLLF